jgi:hypothetical protein
VETGVQAVLTSVYDTLLRKVKPRDTHKLANSLKLRNACGLDGIPNESLWDFPRKPLEGVGDRLMVDVDDEVARFQHMTEMLYGLVDDQ